MWNLFARARHARKPVSPRSVALSLEQLEDRLVPNEMLSLFVTYAPNKEVTLTGQLASSTSGPMPNQTINLGGVVNGTATTDSTGHYSVTLPVSQLGQVTAVSADGQSNNAMAFLQGGKPAIGNFQATCEGGGVWLFSGSVYGAPTQGEVVDLGGIQALDGQHCNVNADGTFSFYATVSIGQGGAATAEAVDWWGDTSPYATAPVAA